MACNIRRADYFYVIVRDGPSDAYTLLAQLAEQGVNLLAFAGVPVGPLHTQIALFPEDASRMADAAAHAGLALDGPHPALLVQGDDELGALAGIHARLAEERVDVYASNGVTDGRGSFGYVLYVRPDEYTRAAKALGV